MSGPTNEQRALGQERRSTAPPEGKPNATRESARATPARAPVGQGNPGTKVGTEERDGVSYSRYRATPGTWVSSSMAQEGYGERFSKGEGYGAYSGAVLAPDGTPLQSPDRIKPGDEYLISDANRGLAQRDPPPSAPVTPARAGANASPAATPSSVAPAPRSEELRRAALDLGRVYRALPKDYRRLGDWALPNQRTVTGERVLSFQLDRPTATVFGSGLRLSDRIQRYDKYFETVRGPLQRSALDWALKRLSQHGATLQRLRSELADPGFATWMQRAARDILVRSALCKGSSQQAARDAANRSREPLTAEQYEDLVGGPGTSRRCLVQATEAFATAERAGIARESEEAAAKRFDYVTSGPSRTRYIELLKILRSQREFDAVVEAYGQSPAKGTQVGLSLLDGAARAIDDFAIQLMKRPASIWRYRAAVAGGVTDLGLDRLEGFREFALDMAPLVSRDPREIFMSYLGMGLLVIGLLAPGLGAGFFALDVAIGGGSTYLKYLREGEGESAARASAFLPPDEQFAKEYGYGDTALGIAFMLIATANLVRSTAPVSPAPSSSARVAEPPTNPGRVESARGPLDPESRATLETSNATNARTVARPESGGSDSPPRESVPASNAPPERPTVPPPATREPPSAPNARTEATEARSTGSTSAPPNASRPAWPKNQYENVGMGGTARVREVGPGETPLSQVAQDARVRLMREGKIDYNENIAVVQYRDPRTSTVEVRWAKSNGEQHAERVLELKLKEELGAHYSDELIDVLYTERIPCGSESANCYGWIQTLGNARVEYSYASFTTPSGRYVNANTQLQGEYRRYYTEQGQPRTPDESQ